MEKIPTILVTGANGFIGQHLLKHLLVRYKVVALSRQKLDINHKNLLCVYADLTNPSFIKKLPSEIDTIVYLAQSNHFRDFPTFAEDIFQVNIQSLFYLLEWSRQIGLQKFIYTSSANIYNQENNLITETNQQVPISFYAKTKVIAEMLIDTYRSYFKTIILRLFTVYGPRQKNALIPTLIENINKKIPVKIYGKSGIKLSPIFVSDVCEIIKKFLTNDTEENASSIFNVCGNEKMDILKISNLIGEIMNMTPTYEFHEMNEPKGWVGDNSRLMEFVGGLELIPFVKGIEFTIMDNKK